jgi:predicted nucleotidyltransferase component of viral defense system
MAHTSLQDFFLVGGTALALQAGHRISLDIDMFTLAQFDSEELFAELKMQFVVSNAATGKNSLSFDAVCSTGNSNSFVKVDLIRYSYPLLNPIEHIDGIRMLSIEDIIPMKLSAISGRGAKKDFYDIFYLLHKYSVREMLSLFKAKYPAVNEFQIIKSLTYFNDADQEQDPQTMDKVSWEEIKTVITREMKNFANSREL